MGLVLCFLLGLLFAFGLGLSGMAQPAKVIGFLDVTGVRGGWDPSLALVMGGGLATLFIAQRWMRRRTRPLLAERLPEPVSQRIDARLLGGAALFGIGWGLAGFCPGPAVVSLGHLTRAALYFVPAMMLGLFVVDRWLTPQAPAAPQEGMGRASAGPTGLGDDA